MVKQKILDILKLGKKSTAEIANRISRNYYDTIDFLNELREDGKLERIKENKYVYWKIKTGGNQK